MGLGGKPRRQFDQRDLDEIKTMAGLGMPMNQMAAVLKMSESHLEYLLKKNAAARQALEEGRAVASYNVRTSAYRLAQVDPVMMKFWLKTREGFRETDRLEITGKDGGSIEMTVEERKQRFEKMKRAIAITEREAKKNGQGVLD